MKILIHSTYAIIRQNWSSLFNQCNDIQVVGKSGNFPEILKVIEDTKPDLILLVAARFQIGVIEVGKQIRLKHPKLPIIAACSSVEEANFIASLQAGLNGFLLMDCEFEQIVSAVRLVHKGYEVYDTRAARNVFSQFSFTPDQPKAPSFKGRDFDILKLLAVGMTNKEIAVKLSLTERTIQFYLTRLFKKLNTKTRVGAIMAGLKQGLISLDELISEE